MDAICIKHIWEPIGFGQALGLPFSSKPVNCPVGGGAECELIQFRNKTKGRLMGFFSEPLHMAL